MSKIKISTINRKICEMDTANKRGRELSIAEISRVVGLLSDLSIGDGGAEVLKALCSNGTRRQAARRRKQKKGEK